MLYAETLKLVSRLPERRPAATLPSRLDELFDRLLACPGPAEAVPIENAIWNAWMYDSHEGAELALDRATSDIAAQRYDIAETRLARLVRARPDFSEAWNKRATLFYILERDEESLADIYRTLALEPRHFGALCGLGEICLERGDRDGALLAFRAALRVNPHLAGIAETCARLG